MSLEAAMPAFSPETRIGLQPEVEGGPCPGEHVAEVRAIHHDPGPHLDAPARREVLENGAPHAAALLQNVHETVP